MGRFKNRLPELMDLIPRFEGVTAGEHARNAQGFIERLAFDGAALFKDDPDRAARWKVGCMELRETIMHLRRADRPDLAKALREFIQAFEHHTARIYQMAYGAEQTEDDKNQTRQVLDWIGYTYRLSTYAIIASYLDDKHVTGYTHLHLDMETGKWTEESHMEEMTVPKKYRNSTKRI